ncbi:hypothetical protein [Streptomyces sp. NPDC101206]
MLACGGDHGEAPGDGQLDGKRADAAARTVDQEGLALLGTQLVRAR